MEKNLLFDSLFYFQLGGTIVYILFLGWIVAGLKQLVTKSQNTSRPFVSVIIPARNEEHTIEKCLEHLLDQNYPRDKYEIIIVDDNSEDKTRAACESFVTDQIKLFSLVQMDGVSPKKAALHLGIEKSRGEIILTTDADCRAPESWISTIIKYFDEDTAAVASWLYVEENNSLLSKMETLDSLALSFVGAAGFGWKRPFLANGANFAYRRKVYDELNGFDGVAHYVSGDDDLFLQKIHAAKRWTSAFAPEWEGAVATNPSKSIHSFFEQRFRWASKSNIHPFSLVLVEIFVYFYLLSFLLSPFVFFLTLKFIFLFPFILKYCADVIFMIVGSTLTSRKINPFLLFLTEWLQILYVVIVGIGGLRGKYTWKGRRYAKGRVK